MPAFGGITSEEGGITSEGGEVFFTPVVSNGDKKKPKRKRTPSVSPAQTIRDDTDEETCPILRRSRRSKKLLYEDDDDYIAKVMAGSSSKQSEQEQLLSPPTDLAGNLALKNKPTSTVAKIALKWLEEIDLLRAKCGKLQSNISGQMKRRINIVKEVVQILSIRAESTGEEAYIKKQNSDLNIQLRALHREEARLKNALQASENKVRELRTELTILKV